MIIKLIQGQDFSGLEHYLTHKREHEIIGHRGVSSPEAAAEEMNLVAAERPDVKVPALHVIFAASPSDWAKMCPALWSELTSAFEAEFSLGEHQKLEVEHPHPDKQTNGPHRHSAYNKVHPFTFALPAKGREGRSSWDTAASHRAWKVADIFAERHGLTRVADPTKVDAGGRIPNWMIKREQQDGIVPVAVRAEKIRNALSKPDWSSRLTSLAELGLKIAPTFPRGVSQEDGNAIAGIRIVDAANSHNFVKASAFGREFSYEALERSRAPGSPELSKVLGNEDVGQASERASLARPFDVHSLYHLEFEKELKTWRRERGKVNRQREKMLARHKGERSELTQKLSSERLEVLKGTPLALHPAAREMFNRMQAEPRRSALSDKQAGELRGLRNARKPVWSEWLESKAASGDTKAAELLRNMSSKYRNVRLKAEQASPVAPSKATEHCEADGSAKSVNEAPHEASAEREVELRPDLANHLSSAADPSLGAAAVPPLGPPDIDEDFLRLQAMDQFRKGGSRTNSLA
ncbi:hypothetical protein GGQ97_001541 [Sphingomonas kaistensis]|uniref:MobA/VirD2-like nuclease domain-containing protein n=1 Tax=Sphingomonas kaistensis TaxID=298708 RepID=A0A7X5Y6P7_9SPHN|nr:hypothetical protein [Sphingomonas kaistensis]NJC05748.1 hypothetical protein [Sphingomonas kaistensis]